ncbi:DUF5941 domain-containing protein [Streptomyces sp. NPDC014995]|uniref:DUF5941 domain-containing protein n=1 Tax=Streptomyces sp. NPDC014995 TaxID=3364936 RepID=UPI0036F6783E
MLTAAPVVALSRPWKGAQDWLVPPLFRAAEDGRPGRRRAGPRRSRRRTAGCPAPARVRTPRDA